tara:strand:- start:132695 stop:133153 length:459 start_codon:yes stop_codon:yes gene_type:complete
MSTVTIDAPEARTAYPSIPVPSKRFYQVATKIVIWSLGTIIFSLAMIDFYAQTHASETGIALQSAQAEKLEINQDLRISDIGSYIVGSPTVETRPADKYTHMCKEMKQYTWKGFFKNYSISVYMGLGNNPSIDFVHGPGDLIKDAETQNSSL